MRIWDWPKDALSESKLGVIYDAGPTPRSDSDADSFPLAELAPYEPKAYAWNVNGSGIARRNYNFPVMLLNNASATRAAVGAASNAINVSVHWDHEIHSGFWPGCFSLYYQAAFAGLRSTFKQMAWYCTGLER